MGQYWEYLEYNCICVDTCILLYVTSLVEYSIVSHGILDDGTPLDYCMTESHVPLSWAVYYPSRFVRPLLRIVLVVHD